MKTIKSFLAFAMVVLMGTSAVAADMLIEIVGTETKSFTSAKTVQANYYWRYFLQSQDPAQSGMSLYTDYVVCDSTNGPKNVRSASAATKTANFTGKKFTPGYVRVWLQQRQGTSGNYATVESFYAYVAQTDAVSATVGGGNKTIATPTISAAAAWTCQSANPGVATATVNSGSATSRTVTITPVAAGTTTIDVRSGSATSTTGNPLRQRITVTVTGGAPAPTTTTNTVNVVEGETVALVTSKNVYSGQSCTFSVDSGSTSNVNIGESQGGSFGTANITKTATSTAPQTIYAKGIAFTPDRAIVKTTGYRYDSTASHTNIDVFVVNVAKADASNVMVGSESTTISTPTITTAANWALKVADTRIATATIQSGSSRSRTITITPVAAGTTTIDVCSGSTSYSTNSPLRQRITVTVAPPVADVVVSNAVFVANGRTAVLTNDVGQTIAWNVCTNSVSGDEKIAKVVTNDACMAVSCTTNSGYTTVTLMTAKTNYHFTVCSVVAGIEKTVKQYSDNESNATIRITTHIDCLPPSSTTNNILYISSGCETHGCSTGVLIAAVNALAAKGNVDWHLYFGTPYHHYDPKSTETEIRYEYTGKVSYGDKFKGSLTFGKTNEQAHCSNLHSYLNCLDENMDLDHQNYDYIVLSFDAGMLAYRYEDPTCYDYVAETQTLTNRKERVAQKLRWYYQNNRVIWLVPPTPTEGELRTMAYQGNESFYRPSNQNRVIAPAWSETDTMPDTAWETFVAMLDPETFLTHPSGQRYVERDQRYPIATWAKNDDEDPTGPTYYLDARAANRNELQVAYDDADKVAEYLDKYIQKASYSAEIKDNIVNLNGSLSVKGNRFYVWKGSTAPETQTNDTYKVIADLPDDSTHWTLQASSTSGSHTVVTNLSDLTSEQWFKYEIDIVDNGTFLDEALKHDPPYATKDPATGRYRINPNDGNAKLTLFATLNGKTTPIVEEDGTLMNRWLNDPESNLTLWITDHADAGVGKAHLQFEPTFWEKLPVPLSDWAQEANDLSRFAMVWGKTPAEIETCIREKTGLVPASLRKGNASLPQSDKRVWLTVDIPSIYLTEQGGGTNACSKIVIRNTRRTFYADSDGFDTTPEGTLCSTTYVPGDYRIIDLTTGASTIMENVTDPSIFSDDEYKTEKMVFRYVPDGKFKSYTSATNGLNRLIHNDVALSAYWIAIYHVTEAQYNKVMGIAGGTAKPVGKVSWNAFRGGDWENWDGKYENVPAPDEGTFLDKLNTLVESAGNEGCLDLPTTFQWERAARAGTRTDYFFSETNAVDVGTNTVWTELGYYANNKYAFENFKSKTKQPVGSYLPNSWGLYDVYGNANDFCLDYLGPILGETIGKDFVVRKQNNPDHPEWNTKRIMSGGYNTSLPSRCSSVVRNSSNETSTNGTYNCFRLAIRAKPFGEVTIGE